MLYKLRHTPNAANILASSEYAVVRLLLKHQPKALVKLLNNPVFKKSFFPIFSIYKIKQESEFVNFIMKTSFF